VGTILERKIPAKTLITRAAADPRWCPNRLADASWLPRTGAILASLEDRRTAVDVCRTPVLAETVVSLRHEGAERHGGCLRMGTNLIDKTYPCARGIATHANDLRQPYCLGFIPFPCRSSSCSAKLAVNTQETTVWQDPSPHKVQFVTVDSDVRLEVLDWGGIPFRKSDETQA
jgi:hypothetical protein